MLAFGGAPSAREIRVVAVLPRSGKSCDLRCARWEICMHRLLCEVPVLQTSTCAIGEPWRRLAVLAKIGGSQAHRTLCDPPLPCEALRVDAFE